MEDERFNEKKRKKRGKKTLSGCNRESDGRSAVTFGQRVAQTQRRHDVVHVAVDALGHSGILREQRMLGKGFTKGRLG